jgi:hypothetical protein
MAEALFKVGDLVEKCSGDYHATGRVVAAFTVRNGGPFRYVVCHKADKGGELLHIYSADNLRHLTEVEERGLIHLVVEFDGPPCCEAKDYDPWSYRTSMATCPACLRARIEALEKLVNNTKEVT